MNTKFLTHCNGCFSCAWLPCYQHCTTCYLPFLWEKYKISYIYHLDPPEGNGSLRHLFSWDRLKYKQCLCREVSMILTPININIQDYCIKLLLFLWSSLQDISKRSLFPDNWLVTTFLAFACFARFLKMNNGISVLLLNAAQIKDVLHNFSYKIIPCRRLWKLEMAPNL